MMKRILALVGLFSIAASAVACSGNGGGCTQDDPSIMTTPGHLSVQPQNDGRVILSGDAGADEGKVTEACSKLQCAPGLTCVVTPGSRSNDVYVSCGKGPC
jgi:hypothetical protein